MKDIIHPFDYGSVTLDGGPLRRQFDEVKTFYMRIPNDDLLKGFRGRAGRPAPGVELGGWYSRDWGNCFGQILSGLSRFFAATQDGACRDKVAALVREWAACLAPDGYAFYSHQPGPRLYMYEKMVCGLLDAFLYCGIEQAADALARITRWADANLARRRKYANADPNMSTPDGDVSEWYTLPESLYHAYLATGDDRYRTFAADWHYDEFWDLLASGTSIFAPRANGERTGAYHAYSHVNSLSSAAMLYALTGSPRYLQVLRGAYDTLQAEQCFATGGYGPNELLLPRAEMLAALADTHSTFETPCGSWAALKLAKYLTRFTGEARYGDWVEQLLYNGIGATLPSTASGGVMYYSDYHPGGGTKRVTTDGWECCSGTRIQAVADYADQVYFSDGDALCISQFAPSTVRWQRQGQEVVVRQRTRFPEDDRLAIEVSVGQPTRFSLKLRRPGWQEGPVQAALAAGPAVLETDARGWLSLEREWQGTETLAVNFHRRLRALPLDTACGFPTAIACGPVVLAARSPHTYPLDRLDLSDLQRNLEPAEGEPLTYHAASDHNVLLRPFYAFREGEEYYLYLDPTAR